MKELFTRHSPGALTLRQAVEKVQKGAREQRTQRQKASRTAQQLARQGRGSDTEIAHVARGEIVVPRAMQNPNVIAVLRKTAASYGVPLELLSVGNAMNHINPATGIAEFGVMDWISGLFSGGDGPRSDSNNNDNNAGGVCRTAGYECLDEAGSLEQAQACHTAEKVYQDVTKAAPNFPENARIIATFPHGRTVIVPGGGSAPWLGPIAPSRF